MCLYCHQVYILRMVWTQSVRSNAWLAVRVSLRLALMPRTARARRSHRLRAALAAAPFFSAHALGSYHMEKTYHTGWSYYDMVAFVTNGAL